MDYENEIIDTLINHRNGMDACWLACEVLDEEYPEGVNNPNFIYVLKDIFQLTNENKLQRKNIAIDIAIISIEKLSDESN